jgi:hypothetical protein
VVQLSMVNLRKTPAFWIAACSTRRRFKSFRVAWENLLGVSLPEPSISGADSSSKLSCFKEFCSGLIEARSHIWNEPLRAANVSSDMRWSLAHSLFLFRKCLSTDAPSVPDFIRRVSEPDGEADPLFIEFIQKEIPRLFHVGWDKQYSQRCLNTTVPTKSCSENGRMFGGSRGYLLGMSEDMGWEEARADFVESVLCGTKSRLGSRHSRVVAVPTGGKWRVLTVPPVDMNRLRPLHECIYNHISRFKWLLRGDAKSSSFKDFSTKEGELFVSGDYESATDNLNSEVQKEILRLVLQNARHVPSGVVVDAMKSFSLDLRYSSEGEPPCEGTQRRGQMMGNLLSFPLLCLVNYLTFRWLTMDPSIPVKINGDDIVFRARPEVANRWMNGVSASGLVLSRGKTLLNRRYFTLNSLLFKSLEGGCRQLPILRSRTLFGLEETTDPVGSLAGRFGSFCPRFYGAKRTYLRGLFLRENSGYLNQSRRSCLRGLGMNITAADLKVSGLWARELRYLSLPSEKAIPPTFSCWAQVPEGFEIGRRSIREHRLASKREGLQAALVEAAWKPARQVTFSEYREAWFSGSDLSERSCASTSSRFDRLARLTNMSHAWVRSRLRVSSLHWAFNIMNSFSEWHMVKDSGKVDLDLLWRVRVDQREKTVSYYRPVDNELVFGGPGGNFTVSKKIKQVSTPPGGGDLLEECPICMEDEELIPLPCGHNFCFDCRGAWMRESKTCPLCRMVVPERRKYGSVAPPPGL